MKNQGLIAFLLAFVPGIGFSNPQGGQVSQGSATITQQPGYTHIQQSSDRAIINWQSFNIKANEHTHFQQPSSSSATLNRINAANGASQIFGRLSANGNLFLVNNAGIVFGRTARVDVGGLVATTANITDANFMAGHYHFQQSSKYPDSSVVNYGNITIRNGGMAALVAPGVENHGVIQANLGKVALGSGTKFTLDFYGDNLIHFATGSEIKTAARDANGKRMKHGVLQNGKIIADGGRVQISARAAEGVVANVINMKGYIQANSVRKVGGTVYLGGGRGTVRVSGRIKARGKYAKQRGGRVKIASRKIRITKKAQIDVSGRAGGGKVYIGGNKQGKGPLPTAEELYVGPETLILANAIDYGDGGEVILWSNTSTKFYGEIQANGGAQSGNGGFVETSGKKTLDIAGARVSASAVNGKSGQWLLDPTNFDIDALLAANFSNTLNAGTDVLVQTSDTGPDAGDVTFLTGANVNWNTSNVFDVFAHNDVIFQNGSSVINTGAGTFNVRADVDADGNGTIIPTAMTTHVTSNNGGFVNFFYNPVSYATPTDFTTAVSATNFNAYMLVNNATDLQSINTTNLNGDYALGTDVDLSSIANFTPIGSSAGQFTGTFDGNSNVISNLTINLPTTDDVGLFGFTNGATISNVVLVSPNITGQNNVGSLVGRTNLTAITDSLSLNGLVTGNDRVGGLVGQNTSISTLDRSSFSGAVSGQDFVGGLVGENSVTTIIRESYSSGIVSGNSFVGGLAGISTITGIIENSYSTAQITGSDSVGGLVGISTSSVDTSYSTGLVTGVTNVGGLIGNNLGAVNNSFWDAVTTAQVDGCSSDTNCTAIGGNGATLVNAANRLNLSTYLTGGLSIASDLLSTWTIFDGSTRPLLSMEYSTIIRTPHQLQLMAKNLSADYTLANDIDLTSVQNIAEIWGTGGAVGVGFVPIGTFATPFTGSLEGNNHEISNLLISIPGLAANNVGLFGVTNSASIMNLSLVDSTIDGNANVGSLIGVANNNTVVHNIHVSSTGVTGINFSIGGLIGEATNSTTVSDSSFVGAVTGFRQVGGLIGRALGVDISNSKTFDMIATSAVTGTQMVGGLVGVMEGGSIINSETIVSINAISQMGMDPNGIGGIVGEMSGNLIDQVTSAGILTTNNNPNAANIGGIAGVVVFGTIQNATNFIFIDTGDLGDQIGGIVGTIQAGTLDNVMNTVAISGGDRLGGLIGWILPSAVVSITNSTNNGDITANVVNPLAVPRISSGVGGLIGLSDASTLTIVNGANNGNVRTVTDLDILPAGGLIGTANSATDLSISNSRNNGMVVDGFIEVGGLIGTAFIDNNLTISDITNNSTVGTLTSLANVGGLIGSLRLTNTSANAALINAQNNGDVGNAINSPESVGGLVGLTANMNIPGGQVTINDSSNTGNITGSSGVGGLVGNNGVSFPSMEPQVNLDINNSFNTGQITGFFDVGGLIGQTNSSTITHSYNVGLISASTGQNIGGLLGSGDSIRLLDSFNTGNVVATNNSARVGGLVGFLLDSKIQRSFNSGNITGALNVGGIVGELISVTGELFYSDVYNAGDVTGDSMLGGSIGGFFGNYSGFAGTRGFIQKTYSSGKVTAPANIMSVGGYAGSVDIPSGTLFIVQSFWDSTNSEQAVGIPPATGGGSLQLDLTPGCLGGVGCLTGNADLSDSQTFIDKTWDFTNVWGIVETKTRPFLQPLQIAVTGNVTDSSMAPIDALNIFLAVNGAVLPQSVPEMTDSNGDYAVLVNKALLPNNPIFIAFTDPVSGIEASNVFNFGGSSVIANLKQESIQVQDTIGTVISNTDLLTGKGALLPGEVLYQATAGNGSAINIEPGVFFETIFGSAYVVDGDLISSGDIRFGGPVVFNGPTEIATTGTLTINTNTAIIPNDGTFINVNNFILESGDWTQIVGQNGLIALSPFLVTSDFQIHNAGIFKRFDGGTGTPGDPFLIDDVFGLQGIGSDPSLLGNSYAISNNLDISAGGTMTWNGGAGFVPIGDFITPFTGQLSTQAPVVGISSLFINRPGESNVGLFGQTNGATFTDVRLYIADITGGDNVGGLIGVAIATTVNNSSISGMVTGQNNVGGLIGLALNNTSIIDSTGSADVAGVLRVGGLVGEANDSSITNSEVMAGAMVSGTTNAIGGLVGLVRNITIIDSENAATVNGVQSIGGLIGQVSNDALIQNSSNSGDITASGARAGGLIGGAFTNVMISNNSFNIGTIMGSNEVGGLIGIGSGNVTVTNSHNSGPVSGGSSIGGLVGNLFNSSSITDSNNSGMVSGGFDVGGLVGFASNDALVTGSSNTGNVSGSFAVGGLVGRAEASTVINSHHSIGTVSGNIDNGDSDIGGLIGQLNGGSLIDSTNAGAVSGFSRIGGLVGSSNVPSVIQNSHNSGLVEGANDVGGLTGLSILANIIDSTNSGDVSGVMVTIGPMMTEFQGFNLGGLIGWSNGLELITNSHSTGNILGVGNIGGLIGQAGGALLINSSSTVGTIEGIGIGTNIGGLIGRGSNVVLSNSHSGLGTDASTVRGLTVVGGLIGLANGVMIENNSSNSREVIASSGSSAGGLVGRAQVNTSTINDASNSGTVVGQLDVGGIVGFVIPSTGSSVIISNTTNTGNVGELGTTGAGVGGIVGSGNNYTITNTHNFGTIQGESGIGGITGIAADNVIISQSTNEGNVVANTGSAGGLVGSANNIQITNSKNLANVDSLSDNVGGLIGDIIGGSATVERSYNLGNVSGNSNIGGIIGTISGNTVVQDVYNQGGVSANVNAAGGIVGTITTGETTLNNVYNSGLVTATSLPRTGGLVGFTSAPSNQPLKINNSFWDVDRSGQVVDANAGLSGTIERVNVAGGCLAGPPCMNAGFTANLSQQATYTAVGWDFTNIWGIDQNISPYPTFNPQAPPPGPQINPVIIVPGSQLPTVNPEDLFPQEPKKKDPDAKACVKASAGGTGEAAEECAKIIIEE